MGCQGCRIVCPAGCISASFPRSIDTAHCLHCGNCYRICPAGAVERRDG
nr:MULTISPECIES: 4Fe-4S binding protein [Agathobaculum]